MSRYAKGTYVSVAQSQSEIQRTLMNYGATEFMFGQGTGTHFIAFQFRQRAIKIRLDGPSTSYRRKGAYSDTEKSAGQLEQETKQRFRCLLLIIKAKLEAVESGIVTVEQEFMPYLVMPDGRTVAEHSLPMIHSAYASGKMPKSIFGDEGQRLLGSGQ